MISVSRYSTPTDPSKQAPTGREALDLLKGFIENYENHKSNLKKQKSKAVKEKEVFKDDSRLVENIPKNAFESVATTKKASPKNTMQSKAKKIPQTTKKPETNLIKHSPKIYDRVKDKSFSNPRIRNIELKHQKKIVEPSDPKNVVRKNKSIIKSEDKLCCDASLKVTGRKRRLKRKQKPTECPQNFDFDPKKEELTKEAIMEYALKCKLKVKKMVAKLNKVPVEINKAGEISLCTIVSDQQDLKEEHDFNLDKKPSDSVVNDKSSMHDDSRDSVQLTASEGSKYKSAEPIPMTCEEDDLKRILINAKYNKSEMDILLDELGSFPRIQEAIDKFSQVITEQEEVSSCQYQQGNTEHFDKVSFEEKYHNIAEIEEEQEEDEVELFAEADEEETSEETSVGEEFGVRMEYEVSTKESSTVEEVQVLSAQLRGILYKVMSRYYTSRVEGLMSIKDFLDEENAQQFLDILRDTVKDHGLPTTEEALRNFLSNFTNIIKAVEGEQGMTPLKAAEYYECSHLKKLGKGEKYGLRKTSALIDLFAQKYPIDRDLFEILSPYLQTVAAEEGVKESKTIKKVVKRRKRKKKKKVVEEDNGPFNILLRSGIGNKIWRSALMKLKKKTDVLKRTIEHKQKAELQNEKYHQHFANYFKTKRKEIKRLRRKRKTSVLQKVIHLDLSEAESTSSFSSGDYYPERELMNSLLPDYREKTEFPIPGPQRKKKKIWKREKLKKEKLHERSGCDGGIRGAPNTPMVEKTWHEKMRMKSNKRRARVVEEYLYSSCDEITGLSGPPQKDEKRLALQELSNSLLTSKELKGLSEEEQMENDNESETKDEIKATKRRLKDLKYQFFKACSKFKMMFVYKLVQKYTFLKPPFDEHFMRTVVRMARSLGPFELMSSHHYAAAKKFLKLGVRTSFGMYYLAQKESEKLGITENNLGLGEISHKEIITNSTIQGERHSKWLRRYFGIESSFQTERKMPLYFGPSEEDWLKIGPIIDRKKQ